MSVSIRKLLHTSVYSLKSASSCFRLRHDLASAVLLWHGVLLIASTHSPSSLM